MIAAKIANVEKIVNVGKNVIAERIVSVVVANKMGRPKLPRRICSRPCCCCYRPEGPRKAGLTGVTLQNDEFEALKLHDVDGFNQGKASKKMKISQPTFARILSSAHQKVSFALIKGEPINIK
ncbi:MAG TPA: DUF134 domain-containing protein [Candidatus Saccharimonadales bacterium]|nr:DUF134 domain-containing protein [Candidatus Saccharimonadales bacterium]